MASPASIFRRLPDLDQRSRRVAVIAAFAGYPLLQLGYWILVEPGRVPTTVWGPIAIALFSATLFGAVAIYGYSGRRFDRRRGLDERQHAMVQRSLIASYGVVSLALATTIVVATVVAAFIGPFTVDMTLLLPFIVGYALYEPLLPFAALAWIEPDAPSDDL